MDKRQIREMLKRNRYSDKAIEAILKWYEWSDTYDVTFNFFRKSFNFPNLSDNPQDLPKKAMSNLQKCSIK